MCGWVWLVVMLDTDVRPGLTGRHVRYRCEAESGWSSFSQQMLGSSSWWSCSLPMRGWSDWSSCSLPIWGYSGWSSCSLPMLRTVLISCQRPKLSKSHNWAGIVVYIYIKLETFCDNFSISVNILIDTRAFMSDHPKAFSLSMVFLFWKLTDCKTS